MTFGQQAVVGDIKPNVTGRCSTADFEGVSNGSFIGLINGVTGFSEWHPLLSVQAARDGNALGEENPRPDITQCTDADFIDSFGLLQVDGSCDVGPPKPLPVSCLVLISAFDTVDEGLVSASGVLIAQGRFELKGVRMIHLLQCMLDRARSLVSLNGAGEYGCGGFNDKWPRVVHPSCGICSCPIQGYKRILGGIGIVAFGRNGDGARGFEGARCMDDRNRNKSTFVPSFDGPIACVRSKITWLVLAFKNQGATVAHRILGDVCGQLILFDVRVSDVNP